LIVNSAESEVSPVAVRDFMKKRQGKLQMAENNCVRRICRGTEGGDWNLSK